MVIISTNKGKIRGVQKSNCDCFLGIPYVKAPIGDLRFSEPQPMDTWENIKDASEFGHIAPQNHQDDPPIGQIEDEDCLYLNIWTPKADNKARPVMVWIHDGAFFIGSGSRPRTNGERLAVYGNVVVVSFNYRIGALGFLNLPFIPPNLGILDQIAALKWIQGNIEKFGGDPSNITIFGESAGGMSVAILLTLPATRGLFHKAIIESGATTPRDFIPERVRKGSEEFISKLHIEKGSIDTLREVPLKKILRVQQKIAGSLLDAKQNPFWPFVDGKIIPDQPLEIIRKGKASKIPLIIGYNEDELGFISNLLDQVDEKRKEVIIGMVKTQIHKIGINKKNLEKLIKTYKKELSVVYPNKPFKYWDAILSDAMFRIQIIRQLEAHALHQSNIYSYIFTYESPLSGSALHTFEIPFVFGNIDTTDMVNGAIEFNQRTEQISKIIMDTWITFARTGNPNHDGLPEWPSYDTNKRATMILGVNPKIEFAPLDVLREVWAGIF